MTNKIMDKHIRDCLRPDRLILHFPLYLELRWRREVWRKGCLLLLLLLLQICWTNKSVSTINPL